MSQTKNTKLSSVSYPEIEFDDVVVSCRDMDHSYNFNIYNHVSVSRESACSALTDSDTEEGNCVNMLMSFLYAYSSDIDSNSQSKQLVNEYRKSLVLH